MPDIDVGHQRIHYEDTGGTGPVLVFSHSFAMNGTMFAPQISAFRGAYRCISWDERAHGGSPAEHPFTFWDSARDCLALLDHLGIEKASFIGTSQGGFISLRIALLAPERVCALAVLGSSAAAEEPAQKAAFQQVHAAFVGDGQSQPPAQIVDTIAHICLGAAFDAEPWKQIWRQWPAKQASLAFEALVERDALQPRLGEIKAPTLVLHGSDDNSYAPSYGEAIAAGVAQSRGFILIDKGAHFLSITHPEPVNEALLPFLAQYAR